MDGALKNNLVMAIQPFLLSLLVHQLMGFGQVTVLQMLQYLLNSYETIEEIDLEENTVKILGPYDPAEPLDGLILQEGRYFTT